MKKKRKPTKLDVLALDPATSTGWTYWSNGSLLSGTWDLSTRRDESTGMKLLRLMAKLDEILEQGLDLLVFEAARHAAPRMQGPLVHQAKLQGVIEAWCEQNGVEYRGYSPSEIKKHALGSGKGNKKMMVKAAKKKWPDQNIETDDQADSLWILDLALTQL